MRLTSPRDTSPARSPRQSRTARTVHRRALRYEPPFRGHYRHVRHDTTLGGVELPADSHLLLMWGRPTATPTTSRVLMSSGSIGRRATATSRSARVRTSASAPHSLGWRPRLCLVSSWSAPRRLKPLKPGGGCRVCWLLRDRAGRARRLLRFVPREGTTLPSSRPAAYQRSLRHGAQGIGSSVLVEVGDRRPWITGRLRT
jgi:hypothetical protein